MTNYSTLLQGMSKAQKSIKNAESHYPKLETMESCASQAPYTSVHRRNVSSWPKNYGDTAFSLEPANASNLMHCHRNRRKRPCERSSAERRDNLSPPHSSTSSARASTLCGMVSPNAFADLRLTINSYLVGACTGRSAGLSPLRMRST